MSRGCGGAMVLVLLLSAACMPRGPVIDTGPRPEGVGGTLSGTVRAGRGETPLGARRVTAIDVSTGSRFEVSTSANGGYTIKVPAGTYQLEVELRSGETLSAKPEPTQVNVGDLDTDRDFVVAVAAPVGTTRR